MTFLDKDLWKKHGFPCLKNVCGRDYFEQCGLLVEQPCNLSPELLEIYKRAKLEDNDAYERTMLEFRLRRQNIGQVVESMSYNTDSSKYEQAPPISVAT